MKLMVMCLIAKEREEKTTNTGRTIVGSWSDDWDLQFTSKVELGAARTLLLKMVRSMFSCDSAFLESKQDLPTSTVHTLFPPIKEKRRQKEKHPKLVNLCFVQMGNSQDKEGKEKKGSSFTS